MLRHLVLMILVVVLSFIMTAKTATASPPNILLITSEDHGREIGCYGDPFADTPNIDQLSSEGVRFDAAFVPLSVCSPSRACMLTGLYPHQNGQVGLATHKFTTYAGIPNLFALLKAAGYRTGMIGKLHVNPEDAFPIDFRAYPGSNFGNRPQSKFAEEAHAFMSADRASFLLMVNYPDAHRPFLSQQHGIPEKVLEAEDVRAPEFMGVDTPRLRKDVADYYNCLNRLDTGMGMLLEALEDCGKADETIVIWLSDHGAPLARGKVTCYEAGLRVPMVARYPGHMQAGHVERRMVSSLDILPTLLEVTGVQRSESAPTLPGRSLLPLLEGRDVPWREYIFGQHWADAPVEELWYPQQSVRDTRYKLIVNPLRGENPVRTSYYGKTHIAGCPTMEELAKAPKEVRAGYVVWAEGVPVELYDLQQDPHEWTNLADDPAYASIQDRLLGALERWRRDTGDPMSNPELLKRFDAEMESARGTNYRGNREFQWEYPGYLDPRLAKTTPEQRHDAVVFPDGMDGYPSYRIPSLNTSKAGTVLAFCERRDRHSDHAQNDIVLRRSADNGHTWGPVIVVHEDGDNVLVNPCSVVLDSGRILMMYQWFPAGYHARAIAKQNVKLLEKGVKGDRISKTLVIWSDDDGLTWSNPIDVTASTKRPQVISTATGPGIGIVLRQGPHKGRIVMPTNEGWWTDTGNRRFGVYACFSDDGGATWAYGEPAPNGSPGYGNEVQMVELSDGAVMLNSRSFSGNRYRKVSISRNGGQSWSPLVDDEELPEPQCMGSILRYSFPVEGQSQIIYAGPGAQDGRKQGTIRVSYDEGETWPLGKVVEPGRYAYSCLTKLADGSVGLLYEGTDAIRFLRLSIEYLETGVRE